MAFDIVPLVVSAATSFGTSYLANGEYGPISTFSDLWYKKFGYLTEEVKDLQFQREQERVAKYVQDTASLTADAIAEIPPENLHEPRENIARPAISSIEDYGSEEHTRKMFAKLIAASMDSSKDKIAQQSFVEIVKNMAPIDALILKNSFEVNSYIEIGEIRKKYRNGAYTILFTNLVLGITNIEDYQLKASSLSNLERLGLIKLNYTNGLNNSNGYEQMKNTELFKDFLHQNNLLKIQYNQSPPNEKEGDQYENWKDVVESEIVINEGHLSFTPYGRDFCAICLSD
ncbi:hypothetical protein IGI66_000220 [Enterococcus sp. AZ048]|uniref:DUF4393 domain-containing protein n=1 Tax=Enterococcus sp. AZ048 TaxID=2774658 RepID=UPI003F28C026